MCCAMHILGVMPYTVPSDLVGSKDVCARLDINRSTLTRWVADGRIAPAVRLPGRNGAMLFDPADVDALAATLLRRPEQASA